MGCNTSKEAFQPTAANAAGNASNELKIVADDSEPSATPVSPISLAYQSDNATSVGAEARRQETMPDPSPRSDSDSLSDKTVRSASSATKVIDIDENDPEANRAATKIQAAFRGHQTRKNMKRGDSESKSNLQEEFSADNKELCEAATKIQASFRGHLVRKSAPRKDEDEELSKELQKLDAKAPEEELDIDLTDPDLQVAATKIQASFRGHRVRKEKQSETN